MQREPAIRTNYFRIISLYRRYNGSRCQIGANRGLWTVVVSWKLDIQATIGNAMYDLILSGLVVQSDRPS